MQNEDNFDAVSVRTVSTTDSSQNQIPKESVSQMLDRAIQNQEFMYLELKCLLEVLNSREIIQEPKGLP